MSYKIIVDSCGELTQEMKASGHFRSVPLSIEIDGSCITDDESFRQAEFLRRVKESSGCPRSSCPSPKVYMESFRCEEERIYAVTLSAELSGSYNSASLGKTLYLEEYGQKAIHIFNSKSASVGETLIAMKIWECEESGMDFEQVVAEVEEYIEGQNTYFVLETLETLRKNGRLTGIKSAVATALNIKPVMGATPQGTIRQIGQARGMKKALEKMAEEVARDVKSPREKILAISHCNCKERAEALKELLLKKTAPKDIVILDTGGISSLYAANGGIIVVV